jgi:hypothetical protein
MMNLKLDQSEIQLVLIFGGYMVQNLSLRISFFIFFSNLDELKTTFETVDEDDERKSNIPEFIEVNFSLESNYEIIKKLIFIDISFDRY